MAAMSLRVPAPVAVTRAAVSGRQSAAPVAVTARPPAALPTRMPARPGPGHFSRGVSFSTRSPTSTAAIFSGIFGKKEEETLAKFMTTDLGKDVASAVDEANHSDLLKDYHPHDGEELHLIDTKARLIIATVINKLIDIPIIGEAQEQVIFMKVVDIVCNQIEFHAKEAGVDKFIGMNEEERMEWKAQLVDKINEKIDMPVLNEEQEAVIIAKVVDMFIGRLVAK